MVKIDPHNQTESRHIIYTYLEQSDDDGSKIAGRKLCDELCHSRHRKKLQTPISGIEGNKSTECDKSREIMTERRFWKPVFFIPAPEAQKEVENAAE